MAGESADELARRQRKKAERLLRSADRYERGAAGERRTGVLLDELTGYGYVAVHDISWPGRQRANIDHVLVGPSGVYAVDSKNWSGRVVVGQGTLRQNGYRRDRELASCGEAALALVQLLNTDVVPVLCLVRDEELSGLAQNVHVVTTQNLHRFILSRRTVLTVEQVQWVAMMLRGELPRSISAARERPAREQRFVPNSPPRTPAARPRRRSQSTKSASGEARRSGRSTRRPRGLLRLLLTAVLVIGGLSVAKSLQRIDLNEAVDWPKSQAEQGRTEPGARFGKLQTIRGNGAGLRVTVGKPKRTGTVGPGGFVSPGARLVSVKVVLRNPTTRKWSPPGVVRWTAEDSLGNLITPWLYSTEVSAGRRLPRVQAVWPGRRHQGVVVFELAKGVRLESIAMQTAAFGEPDATWSSLGR